MFSSMSSKRLIEIFGDDIKRVRWALECTQVHIHSMDSSLLVYITLRPK
jgi:hypothetical protein